MQFKSSIAFFSFQDQSKDLVASIKTGKTKVTLKDLLQQTSYKVYISAVIYRKRDGKQLKGPAAERIFKTGI